MISRPRKQNKVHVYCMQKEFHLKYKSVEDVIKEEQPLPEQIQAVMGNKKESFVISTYQELKSFLLS
mgnify:CR=1 FL=1